MKFIKYLFIYFFEIYKIFKTKIQHFKITFYAYKHI